jgi:hypothetical protein
MAILMGPTRPGTDVIARARMRDRHGRVPAKQQLRNRLADEIGAAADDGLASRKVDAERPGCRFRVPFKKR